MQTVHRHKLVTLQAVNVLVVAVLLKLVVRDVQLMLNVRVSFVQVEAVLDVQATDAAPMLSVEKVSAVSQVNVWRVA